MYTHLFSVRGVLNGNENVEFFGYEKGLKFARTKLNQQYLWKYNFNPPKINLKRGFLLNTRSLKEKKSFLPGQN